MCANNCDRTKIVRDIIRNHEKPNKYIKKLIKCCRVPLKGTCGSEIGYTLCSKELIECLAYLYSLVDCGSLYLERPKLVPLKIFKVICDECIDDFITLSYDDSNLKKVRREFKSYECSKSSLNSLNLMLISKIEEHRKNLNGTNHNKKIGIYHLMILYIYASGPREGILERLIFGPFFGRGYVGS